MNTLTAEELIRLLQKLDPNKPVAVEFLVRKPYPENHKYEWVKRAIESVESGFGHRHASIISETL